jgi:hypothetical protein
MGFYEHDAGHCEAVAGVSGNGSWICRFLLHVQKSVMQYFKLFIWHGDCLYSQRERE